MGASGARHQLDPSQNNNLAPPADMRPVYANQASAAHKQDVRKAPSPHGGGRREQAAGFGMTQPQNDGR